MKMDGVQMTPPNYQAMVVPRRIEGQESSAERVAICPPSPPPLAKAESIMLLWPVFLVIMGYLQPICSVQQEQGMV